MYLQSGKHFDVRDLDQCSKIMLLSETSYVHTLYLLYKKKTAVIDNFRIWFDAYINCRI